MLASALQQVAALRGPEARYVRGKPSLLYNYQQAADVDAETLYNTAIAGHEQLCRLDARFRPFASSLLSRAALSVVREQLTAEESSTLNTTLHAFLCVLTNHFLAPAAFQVLEFFIRKYKVNERNVDDLMLCALPYHTTNEFVRLVQVLALKGSKWEWLSPLQDSGASVARDVLVQRCINDQAILRFVCQGAQTLGSTKSLSKIYLSFYAVSVCEAISATKKVSEDVVALLLPHLLSGLKPDAAADYRAATLMIITQLSAKAVLTQEFLSVVMAGVARSASDKEVPTALMVLAHLAMSQPQLQELPTNALKRFLALPGLESELASLSRRNARLGPLLHLLLPALCAAAASTPKAAELLCGLVASVRLSDSLAAVAAASLLQQAGQLPANDGGAGERLQRALRAIDLRYPQQLDAAINAALQEQGADAASQARREAVFAFVQRSFACSSHALVEGEDGGSEERALTLTLAINAPAEAIRCMALQKLDEALQQPDATNDARQLLPSSLLQALQHDTFPVALVALNTLTLQQLPEQELLSALASLLARATAAGRSGQTPGPAEQQGKAMTAAKVALRRVGELAARASGSCADGAAALMLEYVLSDKHSRRLARAALAACAVAAEGQHPLLVALAAVEVPESQGGDAGSDDEDEGAAKTPKPQRSHKKGTKGKASAEETVSPAQASQSKGSKRGKAVDAHQADAVTASEGASPDANATSAASGDRKAASADLNRAIVSALAAALVSGTVPLTMLRELLLSAGGTRCRHLLLLVLRRVTSVLQGADPVAGPSAATPARRTKGKGRAAGQTDSSGISLPGVAAVLLEALQSRLSAPDTAAAAPSVAVTVPADWQAAAAALLDSEGLPTRSHLLQLSTGFTEADRAVLCQASLAALEAAPAEGLAAAVGAPEKVFAQLAAHGAPALQPHLGFLVSRAANGQEAVFLSQFYGLPADMCAPTVSSAALELLAVHFDWLAAAISGAGGSAKWLLRLLGAAGAADARTRGAAVAALATVVAAAEQHGSAEVAGAAPLTGTELAVLSRALAVQGPLLRANPAAVAALLHGAMSSAGAAADASASAPTPGKRRRGSKSAGASDSGDAAATGHAVLELQPGVAASVGAVLLQQLPSLAREADLQAAAVVLAALSEGGSSAEQLFEAGYGLLRQLLTAMVGNGTQQQRAMQLQLATAVLPSFTHGAAANAPDAAAAALDTLLALVLAPHDAAPLVKLAGNTHSNQDVASLVADTAALRTAAVSVLVPELLAVLSETGRSAAFRALLLASAADESQECRSAARAGLQHLPVSAAMLLPLLQPRDGDTVSAASSPQPKSAKRGKRVKAAPDTVAAPSAQVQPLQPRDLDAAIAALELLQWKQGVAGAGELVAPLQALLQRLLPLVGSVAVRYGDDNEEDEADEHAAEMDGTETRSSIAGYAAQLALSALQRLAAGDVGNLREGAAAAGGDYDMALAVRCAQEAPDSAVRNAALGLLGLLARSLPQAALEHVLQVLALINQSAAITDDSHSRAVASTVLQAVVPAWLSAKRDPEELWATVIEALPEVPPHRRLGLLVALQTALPEESGLPIALLLLLERAAALPAKPKGAAGGEEEGGQPVDDERTWLLDLAAALTEQASLGVRLESFAQTLASSLQRQDTQACGPLPRTVVAFVTMQMMSKAVTGASKSGPEATAFQDGCRAIIAQALVHLQQLHPSGGNTAAQQSKKVHRATRNATTALYELLRALEGALDPATYLQALLQLCKHPSDKIVRRALKLFADRVSRIHEDIEDLELLPSDVKQERTQAMSDAATAICAELPVFLASSPPLTRQTALIAVDAATRQFGKTAPGPVLACLPAVVDATKDATAAVRGSALACIAAAARALGPRLVPLLPQALAAVLDAAEGTTAALAAGISARGQEQQAHDSGNDSDDEAAAEPTSGAANAPVGEEQAVLLSGALAAVEALAASLGAFVAPALPRMLSLLLSRAVLACEGAGAAATAARVRAALPTAIPPRLLMAPLLGQLEGAVVACAPGDVAPAQALLSMVAAAAAVMDTKAAAAHQDELFGFVLAAMDTRARWDRVKAEAGDAAAATSGLASLSGEDVHVMEQAALAALVALVMKLSEARFRPVFHRLLEWAGAAGTGLAVAAAPGRTVVLLGAVCALSRRLRSVFVPYYKHLMELLIGQLQGSTAAAGTRPAKKRKKQQAIADAEGPAPTTFAGWLGRMRAVRALHLAFLHDANGAFLDEGRFERLLTPLVAQLRSDAPPAQWQAALAAQTADAELDGAVKLGARTRSDAAGVAVVGALAQMAVAGGSDARWKPLNRAVLLAGRGSDARARLLSLEVVAQLVGRLREEYLVLLPESLPFLAELLEDAEVAVEARAQEVVALLEEVSGEKLDEYLKT